MKGIALTLAVLGMLTLTTQAQDATEWRASLGVNWRAFGDIDLEGFDFSPGDDVYVNGSVVGGGPAEYTVTDAAKQVSAGLDAVDYQSATVTDASDDLDSGIGVLLSISSPINFPDTIVTEMKFSLATAFLNDNLDGTTATEAFGYDLGAALWPAGPAAGPQTFAAAPVGAAIADPTTDVLATVEYDLDLNMYTFGVGWNAVYTRESIRCLVGAGPTLSFIDFDFGRDADVRWADDGELFFHIAIVDDNVDDLGGAYVHAELAAQMGDYIDVGFGVRYDHVFDDISSDFADVDLSGINGQAILSW